VQGLLKHCRNLSGIGGVKRPGIVHRLDKDTSGLLVAAKNDQAHAFLAGQFKGGQVRKCYAALVHGCIRNDSGQIDCSIGRHPAKRKEMAVALGGGRRALTLWRKVAVFQSGFSLLDVFIETGRTHQIRVHLAYTNHPVVGDTLYGFGRNWWKKHMRIRQGRDFIRVNRQMLHAKSLGFIHPVKQEYVEFHAPLPEDMRLVCRELQELENGN
jgi:23S rRNA pseudouridine1911/1915/1917 synthase